MRHEKNKKIRKQFKTLSETYKNILIKEALPVSTAREYTKLSQGDYKKILKDVFDKFAKGKDRIYLPNTITRGDISPDEHIPYKNIKGYIEPKGFKIINYVKGLANDDRKNTLKIGRILNKYSQEDPKAKELLTTFEKDPIRGSANTDEFKIVISRHPYDIAGMSTDRHWVSCMRLKTPFIYHKQQSEDDTPEQGENVGYLKRDIIGETLVAYLIKKDDTNITWPLSRLLIKPYYGNKRDIYYHVSEDFYGDTVKEFREELAKWVNENINTDTRSDEYKFMKALYQDKSDYDFIKRDPTTGKLVGQQRPEKSIYKVVSTTRDENGRLHSIDDQPAIIYDNGDRMWFKHGVKHRDNDKPAEELSSYDAWWQNGEMHRDGDKPAVDSGDEKIWYKHGLVHRDHDLPAVTRTTFNGSVIKEWYKNGKKHRDSNRPARIVYMNNSPITEEWWVEGKKHNIQGPAFYSRTGTMPIIKYFINDKQYSPEEFNKKIKK